MENITNKLDEERLNFLNFVIEKVTNVKVKGCVYSESECKLESLE